MLKKLILGSQTSEPDLDLHIFSWEKYLVKPYGKIALPDNVSLLGHIPVNKLIERRKKIKDPLLGLVSKWQQTDYESTTWSVEAYTRMFEKFFYCDPSNFIDEYAESVIFCDQITIREHSYMDNSVITPIFATSKNVDSTPGYPKFLVFDTEEDYLSTFGWREYIDVWNDKDTLNHRPLWWCFLKNEVLKKTKVQSNDIRMILCADPVFTRIGACYEQDQNNRMKQYTETKKAQVGWTPFFGGINRRIERLCKIQNPQFVELDWTRFDGTIPKELFWRIKQMRFFFLSERFRTSENKARYDWYVKNLLEKLILLPTGEVCHIKKGNPSGQYSTTVDNNMVNVWLTAFEISYLYYVQKGELPSVSDYERNVDFLCYGDDRLLAVSKDFVTYDPGKVITMYKNIFGMWVKPENIKTSDSVEGLSFCGMTLVKTSKGFVGIPNVDKILTTLSDPVRKMPDVSALWGKLVSLRILCENCDNFVKDYLDKQIENVKEFSISEGIELPEVGPNFFSRIW